jgi:hypothetical protein
MAASWARSKNPLLRGRANVSQDILEKHYDQQTQREKMEQRRKYLDNI